VVLAAHEQPVSVAALVRVLVSDELDEPALAILDFRAAVDEASGVVLIGQVDDVVSRLEE
jgi:hypothetical protein